MKLFDNLKNIGRKLCNKTKKRNLFYNLKIKWRNFYHCALLKTLIFTNKFKVAWRKFRKCTSFHGLSLIRRSKFPWNILWLLYYLIIIYITTRFCTTSLIRYLCYDVKTSMTYDTVPKMQFPAITLCNIFPLIKSLGGTNPTLLFGLEALLIKNMSDLSRVINEVTTPKLSLL